MKTMLVVGGSRGIGRETVREAVKAGYDVAFTYLSHTADADALSEETDAYALLADSASPIEIRNAVKQAIEHLGKIDILVLNAGISSFSLITDLSDADWEKTVAVNLSSAFYYAKAVLPDMIRRKSGKIIVISSMWGEVGASCEVHYSATKAGLIGFAKALAKEVGPSGITVNVIAPGVIDTGMNRAHLSKDDIEALAEETPLCRIGKPEEVAKAVLFLASPDADFITGDVLNLSGGFYM